MVVNDLYCYIVNLFRAIQNDPDTVAYWASYPTSSLDLQARREWLRQNWPSVKEAMRLDPFWYDPMLAGVYAWVVSNSIDLGRISWPSDEAIAIYGENQPEPVPVPGMDNRRPHVKPDGTGQGVQAQRQGEQSAGHPDVPGMDGSRPNVDKAYGGQGVSAQRKGQMAVKQPDVPGMSDGMPHVNHGSFGQGVSAQRRGHASEKQPDVPGMDGSMARVDFKPNSGQGVQAQRKGQKASDHPKVPGMNNDMPHVKNTASGTGVQAQRKGQQASGQPSVPGMDGRMPDLHRGGTGVNAQRKGDVRSDDTVPGMNNDMPNVSTSVTSGKGVSAQRKGEVSVKTPDIPGMNNSMAHVKTSEGGQGVQAQRRGRIAPVHSDSEIAPDVLIDNDADPLSSDRLGPWLRDLQRRIFSWYILNQDWRSVLHSASVTGTVKSRPNTTCGFFLDPPYAVGKEERQELYVEEDLSVAESVREWLLTPNKRFDDLAPWYHPRFRIVLCAYEGDIEAMPDARVFDWQRGGGMESTGTKTVDRDRSEVMYANPACLDIENDPPQIQGSLL